MRAPFRSAWGALDGRELIVLQLQDAAGSAGVGEAAPLPGYLGATVDDVHAAIEDCRQLLESDDGADRELLLAEAASKAVLPEAIAAIDLALWDLTGRRACQPAWRLLGASQANAIVVNWTIGATDRAGAAREATRAREAGFQCVKVKVGAGDDAGRLAAVRAAAGPEMAIRIDANGAWSEDEAHAALAALEPVGIELCEEPVSGLAAVARVSSHTAVAVSIDETATHSGALEQRVCAAACLKIASCGGISAVLRAAARARRAGYELYLASTFDGPVGIAAALHAAAVIGPDRPCGLATVGLFDVSADRLVPRMGRINIPDGSGLGLGAGAARWYGLHPLDG